MTARGSGCAVCGADGADGGPSTRAHLRCLGCCLHGLPGRPKVAIRYVVRDGVVEQHHVLRHGGDRAPQAGQLQLPHVLATHQHGAALDVVEPVVCVCVCVCV
jgi:hypothetical protein